MFTEFDGYVSSPGTRETIYSALDTVFIQRGGKSATKVIKYLFRLATIWGRWWVCDI